MSNDKLIRLCFLLSLIAGSCLYGQRAITGITVEVAGSGSVTEKYVQDNIRTKKGDQYVRSRVNEDVVGLMKTGRFEDVQLLEQNVGNDGVKLIIRVRAFPLVTDIKLLLLSRQIQPEEMITNPALADLMESEYLSVKNSKLVKKLKMVKGQQFNAVRLHADEKALENEYLKKGYYPVRVKGQRIGGSVRYIVSEGEKFRIERGEMVFEPIGEGSLSFSQKVLRKKVKTRQRRVWYSPVSWFVDDGKLKPKEYREDVEKLESFYRDQGYLDVQVQISHGADKVLASPEYGALRAKLFQSRSAHAKAVEDLDDALRDRPGRFDVIITIGLPDSDARYPMLEKLCEMNGMEPTEKELARLVSLTKDFSGAWLAEVFSTATLVAMQHERIGELLWSDILSAVDDIQDRRRIAYRKTPVLPPPPSNDAMSGDLYR